uniref:Retrotransposon domain containing protein n=1 Tax=Haemonchus contortus TaxID=6289 RepID=W6NH17_HAECO
MLLRFRIPKFVVTSDVEKAFLQVRLHELDRDATRFFWVRDLEKDPEEENLITYRFTRVTFGLNVSPFLLGATVHFHLRNAVDDKRLEKEIRENLYVDNLILAAETPEEAIHKSRCTREIFAEMGMNLREFLSNDKVVNEGLARESRASTAQQKVLGIPWDSRNDKLSIRCNLPPTSHLTKRIVARQIASVYDPFGWLVPLLTQAKRFQQDLWKHKYGWDTPLPEDLQKRWNTLSENAHGFERIFCRRLVSNPERSSLAVFSDASSIAMSACAYIFSAEQSTLVMAKCKLPSIKSNPTIPKMEMNALAIALRLALSIFQALKERIPQGLKNAYIFSDSQVALSWLASNPAASNLGMLVSNRLKEIRRIVEAFNSEGVEVHFKFVPTNQNPADAGTRGLTKTQLDNASWWEGPNFLRDSIDTWSAPSYALSMDDTQEHDGASALINAVRLQPMRETVEQVIDLSRFSSLTKAKRVMALVMVFVKKLAERLPQARKEAVQGNIPELRHTPAYPQAIGGYALAASRRAIIRNHQVLHLTDDYRKSIENKLRLYKDEDHLWRSKGRIGNAILNADAKSPIFVFPKTPLADLIVKEAHGIYHQGIEHTMATIRSQYWIPN